MLLIRHVLHLLGDVLHFSVRERAVGPLLLVLFSLVVVAVLALSQAAGVFVIYPFL